MPVLTRSLISSRIPGFRHHRNSVEGTRHDAEIDFAIDATPPEHPARLSLTAMPRAIYHAGTDTLDLRSSIDHATSHAPGIWQLVTSSALHLSVSTSSLIDWLPFVAVVRGPALFPVVAQRTRHLQWQPDRRISSPAIAGSLAGR